MTVKQEFKEVDADAVVKEVDAECVVNEVDADGVVKEVDAECVVNEADAECVVKEVNAEALSQPKSKKADVQKISGAGVTSLHLLILGLAIFLAVGGYGKYYAGVETQLQQSQRGRTHRRESRNLSEEVPKVQSNTDQLADDYKSWVHVEMVLDDTGSIGYGSQTWRDIKDGYNAWLERVRPENPSDRVTWTLAKFDSEPRVEGPEMQLIGQAEQLNEKNYLARGGSTALYRSTLARLKALKQWVDDAGPDDARPGMIWVVVLTDGLDNNPGGRQSIELRQELERLKAKLVYKAGFTPDDELPRWQFEMVGLRQEAEQELKYAMDDTWMEDEVESLRMKKNLSMKQQAWLRTSAPTASPSARTYSMQAEDGSARSAFQNSVLSSKNMAVDIHAFQLEQQDEREARKRARAEAKATREAEDAARKLKEDEKLS